MPLVKKTPTGGAIIEVMILRSFIRLNSKSLLSNHRKP